MTKKVLSAAHRILQDGRSMNAMLNGQIHTDIGFMITDGITLVNSPVSLTDVECKAKDLAIKWGGGYYQTAS